jgi:aspartate racemase
MAASNHFTDIAGIIGGVGPEATAYFMSLIIKYRQQEAKRDQDHIPFLVFNNPQIPDRTEYLLNGNNDPLPELIHTAKLLKRAGATYLTIPCNTAHAFVTELEEAVGLEVLNMISLTAEEIVQNYGENVKVGLLATDGTIQSNIYQDEFKKIAPRAKVLIPNKKNQKKVMDAIYGEKGIKTVSVNSYNVSLLYESAQELLSKGASLIVAGCTEIPLALQYGKQMFTVIDPMEVMARQVINRTLQSKILKSRQFEYNTI